MSAGQPVSVDVDGPGPELLANSALHLGQELPPVAITLRDDEGLRRNSAECIQRHVVDGLGRRDFPGSELITHCSQNVSPTPSNTPTFNPCFGRQTCCTYWPCGQCHPRHELQIIGYGRAHVIDVLLYSLQESIPLQSVPSSTMLHRRCITRFMGLLCRKSKLRGGSRGHGRGRGGSQWRGRSPCRPRRDL